MSILSIFPRENIPENAPNYATNSSRRVYRFIAAASASSASDFYLCCFLTASLLLRNRARYERRTKRGCSTVEYSFIGNCWGNATTVTILYVIPSFASSVREKYRRDDGYHPFAESERPFSVPSHLKNFRFRCHQFLVSLLLVFLLGACVQVHKLSALDAAGREFQQTKTSDKTMFLVPFAIAKATANLFSGSLANRFGRKRVGIVGWMFSVAARCWRCRR